MNVDSADVIALMGVYCIVSCGYRYARTALEGRVTVLYRTSVRRRKVVNSSRVWGRIIMWIFTFAPHASSVGSRDGK